MLHCLHSVQKFLQSVVIIKTKSDNHYGPVQRAEEEESTPQKWLNTFCSLFNLCHAEKIKMPCPLLIFSQSGNLIRIVDINSYTKWQTVQIQISWLLQKPTDLNLHCLQKQGLSGFSRTRVFIWCFLMPMQFT